MVYLLGLGLNNLKEVVYMIREKGIRACKARRENN
jgi:hypothetical protein